MNQGEVGAKATEAATEGEAAFRSTVIEITDTYPIIENTQYMMGKNLFFKASI